MPTLAPPGVIAYLFAYRRRWNAGLAQLVERVICNHEVVGSIPTAGTSLFNRLLSISAAPRSPLVPPWYHRIGFRAAPAAWALPHIQPP